MGDDITPTSQSASHLDPAARSRGTVFTSSDGRLRPIWRFLIAAVLFAISMQAAGIIAFMLAPDPAIANAIFRPLASLFLIVISWFLITRLDEIRERPFEAFGLGTSGHWFSHIVLGVLLAFPAIVVIMGMLWWKGMYLWLLKLNHSSPGHILLVLWILATAAIMEELAFRGYPFQRLCEVLGEPGAIAALSLLFGWVHMQNPHANIYGFINTALAGVVLSVAYLRARNLWLAFGVHFGWNFFLGVFAGLPVSGMKDFSVFGAAVLTGPEWLTGGGYGPEAAITGTMGFVILLPLILLVTRKTGTTNISKSGI